MNWGTLLSEPQSIQVHAFKLQVLQALSTRIEATERQLSILHEKRKILEREIASIQRVNPAIRRLPVEILVAIFMEAIDSRPNLAYHIRGFHKDLNALMLVCRSWRKIVVGTPLLWNTIYIDAPLGDRNMSNWLENTKLHLNQTLLRSGEAPLNITVDLFGVEPAIQAACSRIRSSLDDLCDFNEMQLWSDTIDWTTCPALRGYKKVFEMVFKMLVGENGEVLARCRTLEISLPRDEVFQPLWPLFNKALPLLRHATFRGRSVVPTVLKASDPIFHLMPALTTLEVQNISLKLFTACTQLRRVHIHAELRDYDWRELRLLHQFRNLQELLLQAQYDLNVIASENPKPRVSQLHIPTLQRLELIGRIPETVIQAFRIPKLSTLCICEESASISGTGVVELFSVANHVIFRKIYDYNAKYLEKTFSSMFSRLSSAQTIEVGITSLEIAGKVGSALKAEGKLHASCRIFAKDGDGRERETVATAE